MKKYLLSFLVLFIFVFAFCFNIKIIYGASSLEDAAQSIGSSIGETVGNNTGSNAGNFETITPVEIENYGPSSGEELAKLVIKYIWSAIEIAALIFLLVGGVMYITSAGNEGQVDKAKKTIFYAIIGLIVGLLSYILVDFIIGYFF